MKRLVYLLLLLLPFFAQAQVYDGGTLQRNRSDGTLRGSFGSLGTSLIPSVSTAGINGYTLIYNSTTGKYVPTPTSGLVDSTAYRTTANSRSLAQTQTALDLKANLASPSFTGLVTTNDGISQLGTTAITRHIISANNNIAKILSFRTANTQRWAFRVDGNETGANAGGDIALRRYNDAGTYVDDVFSAVRSTGVVTFGQPISGSVTGTASNVTGIVAIANGGTGSATKNFVDLTTNQTVAGDKTLTGLLTGTQAIFNSPSNTLQVQFGGANVLSVNSTLAGAAAPGGVYINTLNALSTRLQDLSVTNLNAGGIVKASVTGGILGIATAGTDYLTPTGSGSGLSGVVLTTGTQSIAGNKTFTDATTITHNLVLNPASNPALWFRASSATKWIMDASGDAFANWQLGRYNDAGTFQDYSISVNRATSAVTLTGALSGTSATFTGKTTINATTSAVAYAAEINNSTTGGYGLKISAGVLNNADKILSLNVAGGSTEVAYIASSGQIWSSQLGTGILKSTSGVIGNATVGTDYLSPTGSGSGLSGVVLLTGAQSIAGAKTLTDALAGTSATFNGIMQIISTGLETGLQVAKSGTDYSRIIVSNNSGFGGTIGIGVTSSTVTPITGGDAYAGYFGTTTATSTHLISSGVVRYTLSSGGNHDFKSGTATFGGALSGTSATFTSDVTIVPPTSESATLFVKRPTTLYNATTTYSTASTDIWRTGMQSSSNTWDLYNFSTNSNAISVDSNTNNIVFTGALSGTSATFTGTLSASNLASNTYPPTATAGSGVSSVTNVKSHHYIRVGNEVTVKGEATIAFTGTGSAIFYISLPIASNLTDSQNLTGHGGQGINSYITVLNGDTTNDRAIINVISSSTTANDLSYSFTYTVQ